MQSLINESGNFYIDNQGILQCFEPSCDNPFIEEETYIRQNFSYITYKTIRTLIIPEGVKGFVSGFMRGVKVVERFELPEGLESIGKISYRYENNQSCVFADCILPSVVIPESVGMIGDFAFGHSNINTLQLPDSLCSKYGRQFKDSYIGVLRLPYEWKNFVSLNKNGALEREGELTTTCYGYLRWPSTRVGMLEFYKKMRAELPSGINV